MAKKKGRNHCFVIMPFSQTSENHTKQYWTNHFKTFLKPLIEEGVDFEAHRSRPLRGDILRQIITKLVVSPIVIADLTDQNPNVFWELGVRQSFKRGTITIAEEGTEIPFDISVKGTLFYHPKDHIKNAEFVEEFKGAIKDCLSHPDAPDSHVLETILGRGTLFEIVQRDEANRRVKALVSEYERNAKQSNHISGIAGKNQKNPKKRQYVTRRLRCSAVELLITNRYLDEEDSFYGWAESYFDWIHVINDQLSAWEQSPDATEKWLLNSLKQEEFGAVQKSYKNELDAVQKKLQGSSPFL